MLAQKQKTDLAIKMLKNSNMNARISCRHLTQINCSLKHGSHGMFDTAQLHPPKLTTLHVRIIHYIPLNSFAYSTECGVLTNCFSKVTINAKYSTFHTCFMERMLPFFCKHNNIAVTGFSWAMDEI